MKSKKLKLIAVLSAITICSSIGGSAIRSSAGIKLPKIFTSNGISSTLSSLGRNVPKVELDFSFFKTGWTKFKGIFTSTSGTTPKTTTTIDPNKKSSTSSSGSGGYVNAGFSLSNEELLKAREGLRPVSGTSGSKTQDTNNTSGPATTSQTSGSSSSSTTPVAPTSPSSPSSPSAPTKKHPAKGLDRFYDGSWDEQRNNFIYTSGGNEDGNDVYSTVIRTSGGDKVTVKYHVGNEPGSRKPIVLTSTGISGNGGSSEYAEIIFD